MLKATVNTTLWLVGILVLAGCITPIREGDKFIKPVAAEVRSPFGTNINFPRLQRCDGPSKVVLFYLDADFTNCAYLTKDEQELYQFGYSQGQGGQVVSGMMNAGAVGAIAATAAGGEAANATASAVQTVTTKVQVPRGHR